MKDLFEYSTPELVRMLGTRFKEYRMRCNLNTKRSVGTFRCRADYHTQV